MTSTDLLATVAEYLRPMLDDVTFVGGQVAPLLITVPVTNAPRPTKDVDLITAATSYTELGVLEDRLTALGLRRDASPEAPVCRWLTPEGIGIDVMPTDPSVLGFSNRWYPMIVEYARVYDLSDRLTIRIPTATLYIAAKWEAFLGRGGNDLASHDLEDAITVVAGRPEIVDEVAEAPEEVRYWLAEQIARFLEDELAEHAIQGILGNTRLIPDITQIVTDRLLNLTEL